MKFLLFFIFTTICANSYAQQQGYWTVKAGESIKGVLGDSIIFRYNQFTPGSVYFRDGTVSTARLNLNLVNGEMEFINDQQDTMTVTNEGTTRYIAVETDTFFFDKISKTFLERVHGNSAAKLAKLVALVPGDVKKIGGYGQASSTSSINSASYFSNGNQIARLTQDKLLVLHKKTTYFVGDSFNRFLPANKKNLRTMFAKKEASIYNFLEENKNVFSNEEELIKLVDLLGK